MSSGGFSGGGGAGKSWPGMGEREEEEENGFGCGWLAVRGRPEAGLCRVGPRLDRVCGVGDFVVGGILGNWMVGGAGRGRRSFVGLTPPTPFWVNNYRGYGFCNWKLRVEVLSL